MHFLAYSVTVLGIVSQVASNPLLPRVKKPRYHRHHQRTVAVKEAFQRSWDGYYKYAFPHDSLRPVTNTFEDDR